MLECLLENKGIADERTSAYKLFETYKPSVLHPNIFR